jgi:glyoxylase-like metal-dependent hydrolase (beta-lactamase superfamily II)
MYYSHTLAVSQPEADFHPTREQVWNALLRRVMEPAKFLPGLNEMKVVKRQGAVIIRELDFGSIRVVDRVTHTDEPDWLRFEVLEAAGHAGGHLEIAIEDDGRIVSLRFTYQTTLADETADDGIAPSEYVRAAYRASDLDTVAVIRAMLGAQ